MSKSKDRFKEQKDLKEIMSNNNINNIDLFKDDINKLLTNDIKIIAKNESQKKLINSIKNNEITIVAGPAGTGKTFVAMAFALSLLRKNTNRYKQIFLVKSVTTLKGEEIGFLKGDLKEKIEPFMWSFMLNMEKVVPNQIIKDMFNKEIIRPCPLAYIRGASIDDSIIIADEMQNVSLKNSRTLLTRIGSNSKLILLGDVNQIDMKNESESSLEVLLDIFDNTDNIGVVRMSREDTNVRNPLINTIEAKYETYLNKSTKNNKGKKLLSELIDNNELKSPGVSVYEKD